MHNGQLQQSIRGVAVVLNASSAWQDAVVCASLQACDLPNKAPLLGTTVSTPQEDSCPLIRVADSSKESDWLIYSWEHSASGYVIWLGALMLAWLVLVFVAFSCTTCTLSLTTGNSRHLRHRKAPIEKLLTQTAVLLTSSIRVIYFILLLYLTFTTNGSSFACIEFSPMQSPVNDKYWNSFFVVAFFSYYPLFLISTLLRQMWREKVILRSGGSSGSRNASRRAIDVDDDDKFARVYSVARFLTVLLALCLVVLLVVMLCIVQQQGSTTTTAATTTTATGSSKSKIDLSKIGYAAAIYSSVMVVVLGHTHTHTHPLHSIHFFSLYLLSD